MDMDTDQQIVQDCVDRGVPIPPGRYHVEQIHLDVGQVLTATHNLL